MKVRSIALAVLTALAMASPALIPAGTAAADVPGYPTIAMYHGIPTVVAVSLPSPWGSYLQGEVAEWNVEASLGAGGVRFATSCPGGPCVYVSRIDLGDTGKRVYKDYADIASGYESSARVRINVHYGASNAQIRSLMCHAAAAVFDKYTRPSGQGCVSADPVDGTKTTGLAADRDYYNTGFNYSYAH